LLDHIDSDFGAADLDGDEAKVMEAADMPWVDKEGPLIEFHRLHQLSGLKVLNCSGEQLHDRLSIWAWWLADGWRRFEPGHLTTLLSIHARITWLNDAPAATA
jgi:hypothetical protein